MAVHGGDEGSELRVFVNGAFDVRLVHGEVEIAGAGFLEQSLPELWADGPVALEAIDIGGGDAAFQVAFDVLEVFRLLAIDVAGEVEVEFVFLDFHEGDHASIFRNITLLVKDIYDLVDVLGAEAVFWAVLHEARAGVDHEDALPGVSILLVDDHDACGDAGAEEEVRGQADDAFDVAFADQVATDIGLGMATEQDAMWQNACPFARALEGADDMQQVGVVALLAGWRAEGLETVVGVVEGVDAGAPAFVGKRRIGDDVVEGLERATLPELGIGQRVALHDERGGVVVKDHVHPRESAGGGVLLLPVQGDGRPGLVPHLQEQGARAAGGVIDGRGAGGFGLTDAEDLRDDAADFGRGVELPLALAALRGEVAHEVFIGIAQNVIAFGPVLREIEGLVLEDGNEVGEPVHHLLAAAELVGVVEVRHVGEFVGIGQRGDDLFVDLIADVRLALEGHHVLEGSTFGNGNGGIGHPGILVADVFDEQEDEDVILVLAGVHAAAQFIAALPDRGVEFGFLERHRFLTDSLYVSGLGSDSIHAWISRVPCPSTAF